MRGPSNPPVPVANVVLPGAAALVPEPVDAAELAAAAAVAAAARRWRVDADRWRLRIGLHAAHAWQSGYHLGHVLRQQGDALRRKIQSRAVGEPVDPHTRFRAEQARSTAATGRRRWRSIRSIPNTVYYGCQVIFKTSNGGQDWSVISPDLSTKDPTRIVSSGGIIGDNLGQFYGEVVFAIAPSEIQKGLIWAGTNDGQLWYTADGGGKWNNVTKNVTGMPTWGNDPEDRTVALRCGDGVRGGRRAHDGRPQAVHLQDHATWARPGRASATACRRAIRWRT